MKIQCRLPSENGGPCPYAGSDQSALIRHEKSTHSYYRKQVKAAARNIRPAMATSWNDAASASLSSVVDWRAGVTYSGLPVGDGVDDMSSDSSDSFDSPDELRLPVIFHPMVTNQAPSSGRIPTQSVCNLHPHIRVPPEASLSELDVSSMLLFSRVEEEKRAVLGARWNGVVSAMDLIN